MQRIMIGNGVCMITEIRKETPVFPSVPERRRLTALFAVVLGVALFNVWLSGQYFGWDTRFPRPPRSTGA